MVEYAPIASRTTQLNGLHSKSRHWPAGRNPQRAGAATRAVRRHDDRDGWDCGRRHFHQPVCVARQVQTGGMAAVAVTFARYVLELTRAPVADWLVAALALGRADGRQFQQELMFLIPLASIRPCGITR